MLSILLVDDEPALLDIAKRFLEKTGSISVIAVPSAREAINLLKKQSFDAIVSDYEMPEMTGVQFLRELRIHGDHTPFIIFTGKGREQIVVEALNAGATFYLEKGSNPKALYSEPFQPDSPGCQPENRRICPQRERGEIPGFDRERA